MAKAKQEESIEKQLWKAAEYKHVVMGLVFLKYISDSFEELLNLVLTPGRYMGLEEVDDKFDFKEQFEHLQKELKGQMKQEQKLNKRINENLAKVLIDG